MRWFALPLLMIVGCGGGNDHYVVVTVDTRPAVHDPASLDVTLAYNDRTFTQSLDLQDKTFPVTFTLATSGTMDTLGITVDAKNSMDVLVGRGTTEASLDATDAMVTLDSADFVVNSEYVNDQFLTDDFEAVGFQVAASPDGTWLVTWRDSCDGGDSCQIYGRRFDATGLPVSSQIAAGDIAFELTTIPTLGDAQPAAAATSTTMAAFWDYAETFGGPYGIGCRVLDAQGAAMPDEATVAMGEPDVVSAVGLQGGSYAVVWNETTTTPYSIVGAIVQPDCTPSAGPFTVSVDAASVGALGARRAHVTANGNTLLYSWITDDNLWIATGTAAGGVGANMKVINATASQTIEQVRISPWADGFAIAVRWKSVTMDGPGKIELYRANTSPALLGNPVLITDQSGSEYQTRGFSIAERASDHALVVAWHACTGPGLCDTFGRTLRPTGAPVGEPYMIPTSTVGDQIDPSLASLGDAFVATWTDSSGTAPDSSGTSVRARILTPAYDDARGVHGATCGASAPGSPDCDEGLACAMGTDSVQRCYYECAADMSCPRGGTCTTADGGASACAF